MDTVGTGVKIGIGEIADGGGGDSWRLVPTVTFGDNADNAQSTVGGGHEGAPQGGAVEMVHGKNDFFFGGVEDFQNISFGIVAPVGKG